jgi:hypothetical protein
LRILPAKRQAEERLVLAWIYYKPSASWYPLSAMVFLESSSLPYLQCSAGHYKEGLIEAL